MQTLTKDYPFKLREKFILNENMDHVNRKGDIVVLTELNAFDPDCMHMYTGKNKSFHALPKRLRAIPSSVATDTTLQLYPLI